MTLPSSQKPKDFAFQYSKNEEKHTKMPYNITKDKLAHMVKRIKKVMKFNKKRFTKIKNLEKERDSMNNHPKKNIKTPPKIRKLNALTMEV